MSNKQDNFNNFSKKKCIETINNLKRFYDNPSYMFHDNDDKEIQYLKSVINECSKPKCPIGYYHLHGKCHYG